MRFRLDGRMVDMPERDSFDPINELVTAQAERPEGLAPVNFRTLTPFQRALLVIDGTVTKFIEAYTMERVEVVRLSQEQTPLAEDHRWLDAPRGTIVGARQVLLRGKYSHSFYAYAVSLVVLDRLGSAIRERLDLDGESLGRILRDEDMETRREVMWYGRERVKELPEGVRQVSDGEFISRTYRIMANKHPIMLITERFPLAIDHLPSHH